MKIIAKYYDSFGGFEAGDTFDAVFEVDNTNYVIFIDNDGDSRCQPTNLFTVVIDTEQELKTALQKIDKILRGISIHAGKVELNNHIEQIEDIVNEVLR